MKKYTAAAFCAAGMEKVVSNELRKLSQISADGGNEAYAILKSGFGKVYFKTDLGGLYRALLSLRTADRLMLETGGFPAPDFDALFEGTRNIPWEEYIPRGMGLTVSKVRSGSSRLKAETSIQAVVHKAAADRLCKAYSLSRLPSPNKTAKLPGEVKQAELRVHLEKDHVSVLLDISGEPLFKRGYRPAGGSAPLRESTAAAIILYSGWRRKFPLYDPLCGSGTIAIEAALYAWDQAPGLGRHFALSSLSIADKDTEETLRRELTEKIDYNRPLCISGSDADETAVTLARANFRRAMALPGLLNKNFSGHAASGGTGVKINCLPMDKAAPEKILLKKTEKVPEGFIITNPPYGKRLGDSAEAEERYRNMALWGKTFPGWKLVLICNHSGFESHFGRKADTCRELKSGAIDAWLYQYERL